MNDAFEFETLLSSVLEDVANPEPMTGAEKRVVHRIAMLESPRTARASVEGLLLNGAIAHESTLASLWSSVRELVFPKALPPLVLESRPVPVADRMAVKRDYASAAYAFGLHAFAILLIGFVVRAQVRDAGPTPRIMPLADVPVLHVVARASGQMGGGGGQRGVAPATSGRLPELAERQIVTPKDPPLVPPKIAIEPSVVVQRDLKLADNVLPNLGVPNSPIIGNSLGNGNGGGIGPGNGNGIGPGSGGNTGGGPRHVGGSVTRPELVYYVDPEFSDEARKAKVSGNVLVYLWVDERGNPTHVRLVNGMGLGLDERAVEAVKQYRFKPAMENGKPVTVEMYVDVTFTIL
jgi:protein TonB